MTKARGSTKNYRFGSKNNWRRSVWNEVLRRTNGTEKKHPILYLAGPDDLDRSIAIEKGVPPHNLIAIDRDRSNVKSVRRNKGIAIEADVLDLLWSWPDTQTVAAVMLDFCCGFTRDVIGTYDAMARRPFFKAPLMINLMRGRDADTNSFRALLKQRNFTRLKFYKAQSFSRPETSRLWFEPDWKSRAHQFVAYHAIDSVSALHGCGSASLTPEQLNSRQDYKVVTPYDVTSKDDHTARYLLHYSAVLTSMNPVFFSYKSGALRFDSVVMNQGIECAPSEILSLHWSRMKELGKMHSETYARLRASAAAAVRTLREKKRTYLN